MVWGRRQGQKAGDRRQVAGGRGQVAGPSYLLGTKGHVLGDAGIARLEGGVNVGMVKKTAKHKKNT